MIRRLDDVWDEWNIGKFSLAFRRNLSYSIANQDARWHNKDYVNKITAPVSANQIRTEHGLE